MCVFTLGMVEERERGMGGNKGYDERYEMMN